MKKEGGKSPGGPGGDRAQEHLLSGNRYLGRQGCVPLRQKPVRESVELRTEIQFSLIKSGSQRQRSCGHTTAKDGGSLSSKA